MSSRGLRRVITPLLDKAERRRSQIKERRFSFVLCIYSGVFLSPHSRSKFAFKGAMA